jgi:hypothetical protein
MDEVGCRVGAPVVQTLHHHISPAPAWVHSVSIMLARSPHHSISDAPACANLFRLVPLSADRLMAALHSDGRFADMGSEDLQPSGDPGIIHPGRLLTVGVIAFTRGATGD